MKKTCKVVDLDMKRELGEALFVCLHEDCFESFTTDIPKRKNVAENIVCPHCERNFFAYWVTYEDGDRLMVNWGTKKKRNISKRK